MRRFPQAVYDSNITRHDESYYRKWAERFKFLRTLSLLALVSAMLISVVFFGDSMTYDNVQLLVNVVDSEYNSMFSDDSLGVTYNSDPTAVFESYDGNLVIATETEVSLYNMSGRELYSYSVSYKNPRIVASESVFIVYDLGGTQFSVYNKIGRIYETAECEYGIVLASASDNGRFCITTKSRESSTCVLVYNKKCKLIGKYENGRHVAALALSDDGEYLGISTLTAENGVFNSVLSVYKIDNAKLMYTVTESDKLPIKLYFTANNKALLFCSDEFFLYSKKGEQEASYSYNADQLDGIAFNGRDLVSLSFAYENSNSKSYMNIVDTSGKVIYNNLNMDKIYKMSFGDDSLFVLQSNVLARIEGNRINEFAPNDSDGIIDIFPISDNELIISHSTYSSVEKVE